jgi:predicted DNA-binding transcriptional regulator YafY
MRRADRLFQLLQLVRGRRLSTGAWLAQRMEVSLRTVYRDIATLQSQGVPIEGEAGVGYRMGTGYNLPPLMFTADQAQALVATVRIAEARLDPALASQAAQALGMILSVLPTAQRAAADRMPLHAGPRARVDEALQHLGTLRQAIEGRRRVHFAYTDTAGSVSQRTVRPLICFHWETVWTLSAWCELRQDFRHFRIDRIRQLSVDAHSHPDEPGKTLADLQRQWESERSC